MAEHALKSVNKVNYGCKLFGFQLTMINVGMPTGLAGETGRTLAVVSDFTAWALLSATTQVQVLLRGA